jgi:hypothetical protein
MVPHPVRNIYYRGRFLDQVFRSDIPEVIQPASALCKIDYFVFGAEPLLQTARPDQTLVLTHPMQNRSTSDDVWFRIATHKDYIKNGRVLHGAFGGNAIAAPSAQKRRGWDRELSGRLRSLAGSVSDIAILTPSSSAPIKLFVAVARKSSMA